MNSALIVATSGQDGEFPITSMEKLLTTKRAPPPAWVIVTGQIRDEAFLLSRFEFLSGLKKSGDIEQVVFSTWRN